MFVKWPYCVGIDRCVVIHAGLAESDYRQDCPLALVRERISRVLLRVRLSKH